MVEIDQLDDSEIKQLKAAGDQVLRDHAGVLPSVVFHYTSLDTAVKILNSLEIWCADVACSNDPSEGMRGAEVFARVLAHDPNLKLEGVQRGIRDIACYGASFSAEGDLLGQWRAYCSNGRGVAIGVKTEVLASRKHVAFSRVEYDPAAQESLVRKFLDIFRGPLKSAALDKKRLHRLVGTLALYFIMLRAIVKDPSYHSEREYRLFDALPNDPAEHDTLLASFDRAQLKVWYFPVDLRASQATGAEQPVREIRVGPCLTFTEARNVLAATKAYRLQPFPMRCD